VRLAGKVALITGAAMGNCGEPMGIGGATAWVFAREGTKVKVALSDVNEPIGRRAADQLRDRGYSAIFVTLDVTSEENRIPAFSQAVSAFGRLDILVNAAGNVAVDGGFSAH
jgi:3-hydroxybutyrate dehydrogenase